MPKRERLPTTTTLKHIAIIKANRQSYFFFCFLFFIWTQFLVVVVLLLNTFPSLVVYFFPSHFFLLATFLWCAPVAKMDSFGVCCPASWVQSLLTARLISSWTIIHSSSLIPWLTRFLSFVIDCLAEKTGVILLDPGWTTGHQPNQTTTQPKMTRLLRLRDHSIRSSDSFALDST